MKLIISIMLMSAIDVLNCRCYDAKASYWDRFPFPEHLPHFIWQYYKPELGKKVLDIGAGTGKVAYYLKECGMDVTCIDPSQEMVRRCLAKGLKIQQTTLQSFETDETFGLVIAILSLIHIPKKEFPDQIRKIRNLLEPKGLFILSLLKGDTEQVEEHSEGYPRFFARYTAHEIRTFLQDSFQELNYYEVGDYMLFLFQHRR